MPVTVYGFIDGDTSESQDAHNILQLQALTELGPYLIKSLFSFVPQSREHAYYGSHIHFAAGYKDCVGLNPEWLAEFETLLSKLYWNEAEVIVTWSKERYVWRSNYTPSDGPPNQIAVRSRFESAWNLKEIPWNS